MLADRADLVAGQAPVLLAVERDGVLLESGGTGVAEAGRAGRLRFGSSPPRRRGSLVTSEQRVVVGSSAGQDLDVHEARRQEIDRHRRGRWRRAAHRKLDRLARLECTVEIVSGGELASINHRCKNLSEQAGCLLGTVLIDEQSPCASERLAESGDELVGDLAQRLRLASQLVKIVPVVDGATAERLAWMNNTLASRTDDCDLMDAGVDRDVEPSSGGPDRVDGTVDLDQTASRHGCIDDASCGLKWRDGQRQHRRVLDGEALGRSRIEAGEQRRADRLEIRSPVNKVAT
jgi:hypothetical protein